MLGPQDLWIALALGVFFFGAKKLPELSRSLGQAMSEFKKGVASGVPEEPETPRPYFLTSFTPNAAFYVRYHLDLIPNAVDLSTWRLNLDGNVERPLQLGFDELVKNFKAISVSAVNQCSGNSRSRFQPRVS